MSEGVDLSQIRGDWKFHMDYVQNAIEQTLKRQVKVWAELGNDSDIDASVRQQNQLWTDLKAGANDLMVSSADLTFPEDLVLERMDPRRVTVRALPRTTEEPVTP